MTSGAGTVKHEIAQDPRKLRKRRIAAGLGVREAAEQAACSPAHVSMLEDGQHGASAQMLARFAEVYGCKIADLMPDEPGEIAS